MDWVAVKPMIAAPISIALPARPAHPNAANLFMDLVLSKEGSELLMSMGRVPTRSMSCLWRNVWIPERSIWFLFMSVAMIWIRKSSGES